MTKEEILKAKGITESTKHHSYEYLYKSMIVAMDEYTSALRSENERLKSELSGNPEQLGWVSVEDGLPEIFEHVLIYTINGRITTANITSYNHWNTDQPEPLSMRQVTHWMPLPPRPKQLCCERYMRCEDCPDKPKQ